MMNGWVDCTVTEVGNYSLFHAACSWQQTEKPSQVTKGSQVVLL